MSRLQSRLQSRKKRAQTQRSKKPKKNRAKPTSRTPRDRELTEFGERLVAILRSKGMNDSDLAQAMGIAQPNIHTLKYKTDRPRHSTVMNVAKALGVAPEALFSAPGLLGDTVTAVGEGTKVYLVIETKAGKQTIRLV